MKFIVIKLIPIIFIIICFNKEVENKSIEKGSFTDLQNKIDNLFNIQLDLDSDYTFDSNVDKTTGIIIEGSIIINGKYNTINGLNKSKILEIYNSEVTLKNINFINGFSKDIGGAINLINSTLIIINCTFSNNRAYLKGGAINLNNSYMNISESIFKFNIAKKLYSCGGVISSENSFIDINKSYFINNSADEGGAIYSINSNLKIKNSFLNDNKANWYGGALVSDSQVFIENSRLYNNIAGYKGGAILTTYSDITEDCFLVINESLIFNNNAEYGGAISSSNLRYIHIFNSEIYENKANYGAVLSRMSSNNILIINSTCYNNIAINGSILYSVAGGNNKFFNDNFKNNTAEVGGIIYTISGRVSSKVTNYNSTFTSCDLIDNYAKKGLIYSIFDELIITNSSITYFNKSYDFPIIYKIVSGKVIENNNWWGDKNPNLNKLIIYQYENIPDNYLIDNNLHNDGCTSTIIQINDNESAFTFRRDSSTSVYVNIAIKNDGILQYKTDPDFFWHLIINKEGWLIGNGGLDFPHACEKLEAYARIMIKKNLIIDELIEEVFKIKSMQTLGHFFIKSPDGTYALVSHIISKKVVIIEKGKLKSGEYIICPNNYDFYQKGNISDLNIKNNYTYISRYLASIDEYSSSRTNDFTYNYNTKNNGKHKFIDIFVSNDDGSLANKSNTSYLYNDIFINDKYILGEKVPIIMDGMYLDRFTIINENININTNLEINIKQLLLVMMVLFI